MNRQGVYVEWQSLAVGLGFTINHWTGIGYRNYFSAQAGLDYQYYPIQHNESGVGVSCHLEHNHRMNLYKLNYLSFGLGYGLIYFMNPADGIERDQFKNHFRFSAGFNLIRRKHKLTALFNAVFAEYKQQVNFSPHTYFRVFPTITIRYSYFFKQMDISEDRPK